MGRRCTIDISQIKNLCNDLEKIDVDLFCEACAKELTARLLTKVVKRTPVGEYKHRVGGNLRRGWTNNKGVKQFADNAKVHRYSNYYVVEIENPVEYASYVEYGHRTRNHNGWVEGKFMLTISEKEIQGKSQAIIQKKFDKWLKEVFR